MSTALDSKVRDINLVDTAKLMRQHLARTFPGIKFSVRTSRFSMGSSADVSWVDGPSAEQVRGLVDCFGYGGFDGMTDSSYSYGAWLCSEHGASYRHNTAAGMVEEGIGAPCCLGAEPVRFGAKYVGQRRDLSAEFTARITAVIEAVTGETYDPNGRYAAVVLHGSHHGEDAGKLVACSGTWEYGSTLFGQVARRLSLNAKGEAV